MENRIGHNLGHRLFDFILISLAIDLSFTDLFKKKQLDFDFIIIPTVFLFQIHWDFLVHGILKNVLFGDIFLLMVSSLITLRSENIYFVCFLFFQIY